MVSANRGSALNLFWAVLISTFVALVLKLISLPQSVFYFWPDWVVLVVIFCITILIHQHFYLRIIPWASVFPLCSVHLMCVYIIVK